MIVGAVAEKPRRWTWPKNNTLRLHIKGCVVWLHILPTRPTARAPRPPGELCNAQAVVSLRPRRNPHQRDRLHDRPFDRWHGHVRDVAMRDRQLLQFIFVSTTAHLGTGCTGLLLSACSARVLPAASADSNVLPAAPAAAGVLPATGTGLLPAAAAHLLSATGLLPTTLLPAAVLPAALLRITRVLLAGG